MPNFPPIIWTVGTTPVKVLNAKARRIQYQIIFPSSTKIAGNTSILYVGVGFPPTGTAGTAQSGHAMVNGEAYGETVAPGYDDVSKEDIYLIASGASQIVEVVEVVH